METKGSDGRIKIKRDLIQSKWEGGKTKREKGEKEELFKKSGQRAPDKKRMEKLTQGEWKQKSQAEREK